VCALRAWRNDKNTPARDSKAAALVAVHEYLMRQPEWKALHEPTVRVDIAHAFRERLLLADTVSRGHEATLRDVCSAIGIDPCKLDPLPERAHAFLRGAAEEAYSAMGGDPVIEHGPYLYGTEVIEIMAHDMLNNIFNSTTRMRMPTSGATAPFAPPASGAEAQQIAEEPKPPDADVPRMRVETSQAFGTLAPARPIEGGKRARNAAAITQALLEAITRPRYATRLPAADSATEARHAATVKATRVLPTERLPIRTEATAATARAHVGRSLIAYAAAAPVDELAEMRPLLIQRSLQAAKNKNNTDGLGIKRGADELLLGLLSAAYSAFDRRFADGTKKLDKSYWRFWVEWTKPIGTQRCAPTPAPTQGTFQSCTNGR